MDSSGTFTFDSSLPTPLDRMRHTLGDTNPTTPLRWDETYTAALAYYGDEALATAKLARALASQFGQQPTSVSIPGGPSVGFSDRVKTWLDTATSIEKDVATTSPSGAYSASAAYRAGISDVEVVSEYQSIRDGITITW